MRLDFSTRTMDVGTASFNLMRTMMVAGTGGAELSECVLTASRIKRGDDDSWVREWARTAETVRGNAQRELQAGQLVSARQALFRASNYYRAAMFPLPRSDVRFDAYLTASRESFHHAVAVRIPRAPNIEVVDIPFDGARLPAYFLSAGSEPRPTLIVLNGGDSTNEEMVHWLGLAAVARNWNCLVFEGPGQWSALQLNPGLVLRPDYEAPVKAAIDYLFERGEVDRDRLALFGPSLGSILAARVVAFEERIRACVCDGLVVDVYEAWHAVWPRLLQRASPRTFDTVFKLFERVSPQLRGLANHFRFMLEVSEPSELIEAWRPYSVRELAQRIQCPMLVLYGEGEAAQTDERVALSALRFIRQLNAPVSVRLFGFDEGWAASHCQIGALAPMQALVFEWLDTAVHEPGRLAQRDIGDNVIPGFGRYFRSREAHTELAELSTSVHATQAA